MRFKRLFAASLIVLIAMPTTTWAIDEKCFAVPTAACLLLVAREITGRDQSHADRSQELSKIAIAQMEAGDEVQARRSQDLAKDAALLAAKSDSHHRPQDVAWSALVLAWHKIDGLKRAIETINAAPNDEARNFSNWKLMWALIESGDRRIALKLASKASSPSRRVVHASHLARAASKVGDLAVAGKALALMEEDLARLSRSTNARHLERLGRIQGLLGKIDVALETARKIADRRSRDRVIHEITVGQAQKGHYKKAIQTLGLITDRSSFVTSIARVAAIAAKNGNRDQGNLLFEQASTNCALLPAGSTRDNAYRQVGELLGQVGNYREAAEAINQISKPNARDWPFSILQSEMIKAGDLAAASTVPPRMVEPHWRPKAYSVLALAQAKHGYPDDARNSFAAALNALHAIPQKWLRASTLKLVAEHQAKAGYFVSSLRTLSSMQAGNMKRVTLGKVAVEMARAGKTRKALDLVRRIGPSWISVNVLVAAASAQKRSP